MEQFVRNQKSRLENGMTKKEEEKRKQTNDC
jgi:hypothetical protein